MSAKNNLKSLSAIATLCAVAYLCMFVFKFKVSFLTFDFKDAILSVISFLFGPIYGVVSAIIVAFFEFISVSDTGVYGLIMNALSSATFAFVCGTIYKYRRTMSGAVIGAVVAVLSMTAVMLLANLFVTPYYMGVTRSDVVEILPILILPFNLCKGIINAAITMIIYKPITMALKKSKLIVSSNNAKINVKTTAILIVFSIIIVVLSVLVILLVLNGKFQFFSLKG